MHYWPNEWMRTTIINTQKRARNRNFYIKNIWCMKKIKLEKIEMKTAKLEWNLKILSVNMGLMTPIHAGSSLLSYYLSSSIKYKLIEWKKLTDYFTKTKQLITTAANKRSSCINIVDSFLNSWHIRSDWLNPKLKKEWKKTGKRVSSLTRNEKTSFILTYFRI